MTAETTRAVGEPRRNYSPSRGSTEKLKKLLEAAPWAKGHNAFQGDMMNAPLIKPTTHLGQIIKTDQASLQSLGYTKEQLGTALAVFRKLAEQSDRFVYKGTNYAVLSHEPVVMIQNLSTKKSFEFKLQFPELVFEHGYFGDPTTAARLDPARVIEFFAIERSPAP